MRAADKIMVSVTFLIPMVLVFFLLYCCLCFSFLGGMYQVHGLLFTQRIHLFSVLRRVETLDQLEVLQFFSWIPQNKKG